MAFLASLVPLCHDAHVTSALRRALEPLARPARKLLDPAVGTMSHLLRRTVPPAPAEPSAVAVRPCAEPYAGGEGRVGVLLAHGFAGSPGAMRPWGQHLAEAGYRVSVPRFPGHGTSWQELNATSWTDWYATAEQEFTRLREECDHVFLAGLSMGGGLVLRMAAERQADVAGLVLVNPCINITDPRIYTLPVLHRLTPTLAGFTNDIAKPGIDECAYDRNPLRALYSQTHMWAEIRSRLHEIHQPLLVFKSRTDHVVDPSSLKMIMAGVRSPDCTLRMLERSYHVATLDYDAEDIFGGSVEFFRRLVEGQDAEPG